MKLKKLHETALWCKLNEQDFRNKTANVIVNQNEDIEKLFNITTKLIEEINLLKQKLGFVASQNNYLKTKMSRQTPNTEFNPQGSNDSNQIKQNRNN